MPKNISWVVAALAIASLGGARAEDVGKKVISTPAAPNAIGPYSQAVRVGNTLYISGEIAIDPKTNQVMLNAPIEDQARPVLDNIMAIVAVDGLTMDQVVSTTVFLTDINEFDGMNNVYATYFKGRLQPGLLSRSPIWRAT
jgi:2-iminobutanoate/2-iminopropanoate deaminase